MKLPAKSTLQRTTGALLILLALGGWLLSLGGLIALWNSRPQVEQDLGEVASLLTQALDTTGGILQVIDDSLVQAADTLSVLQSSLDAAATSLGSTAEVVDQVGVLVGEDLVGVLDETQASLDAASTSARLVDDTLRVISSIPFIGQQYQPEVTLSQSITNISLSLEGMKPSLTGIQEGVETSGRKLDEVHWMLLALTGQIKGISPGMYAALQKVDEYLRIVSELQAKSADFEAALPAMLRSAYTLGSLLLGWAAISQFSPFVQGLQLFAPGLFQEEAPADAPPVA